MKIAYICGDFGIPVFGHKGASVHLREMVSAFMRCGHEVDIFSPVVDGENENVNNLSVVEIKQKDDLKILLRDIKQFDKLLEPRSATHYDLNRYLYNTSIIQYLSLLFKEKKYDLIYERYSLFCYASIVLSKLFKIPHFLEVNAPLCDEQDNTGAISLKELAYSLEKSILSNSDRIFVVSDELSDFVQHYRVDKNRVCVLPNGVDSSKFKPTKNRDKIRRKLNLNDKTVIGFVGNIRPWNDIGILIEVLFMIIEKYQNVHLLIVGDSPFDSKFVSINKDSELLPYITCTGFVNHSEVPDYISAMDIAVAPYLKNSNFYFSPMKILEYMSCEKSVIAANLGQINCIINNMKNGILYEPENKKELYDAILYLIENEDKKHLIGKEASEWIIKNRSWDNNAKIILDFLI